MNEIERHFGASVSDTDPDLARSLQLEAARQGDQIELIASENIVSKAVLDTLGSQFTNKTVEGYPGRRFHGGAQFVDIAERLAIERAKALFGVEFANVQSHSGTQANQSVFLSLLSPGDTVMSLSLAAGGHLSHGAPPNLSGKWFNIVNYGVDPDSSLIDYDIAEQVAQAHRPKLIITGGSAYPRSIDFERMRRIADDVGAMFLVDMAHFAGLVAAGAHPSPVPWSDIVTCTTTKTLRGPRGGLVLTNDTTLGKRIDACTFPGVQGSVHLHHVAAKAVCLGEALRPEFKQYGNRVVTNARALASALQEFQIDVLTGGTDTHLLLVNLKALPLSATEAEERLDSVGITCNKNPIPSDGSNPAHWSGLRFGVAAGTTRGFNEEEFAVIGRVIGELLTAGPAKDGADNALTSRASETVSALCRQHPLYR